jgi:hypothetical protein
MTTINLKGKTGISGRKIKPPDYFDPVEFPGAFIVRRCALVYLIGCLGTIGDRGAIVDGSTII